ncbi:hypothetical protein RUND412_005354 [Rhizina undulata]
MFKTVAYLQRLSKKIAKESSLLPPPYVWEFAEISNVLVEKGILNQYHQMVLFLQGFPELIQSQISQRSGIHVNSPETFTNFQLVRKEVLKLWEEMEVLEIICQAEGGLAAYPSRGYCSGVPHQVGNGPAGTTNNYPRDSQSAESRQYEFKGCFWCWLEGYVKTNCNDYNGHLRDLTIHYPGTGEFNTLFRLKGNDGPLVPLPFDTGISQKQSVKTQQAKRETNATAALHEIEDLQVHEENLGDEEENLISFVEDPDPELLVQRGIYKPVIPVHEEMLNAPVPPKPAGPSAMNNNPAGSSVTEPPSQPIVEVPTEVAPGAATQNLYKAPKEKVKRMSVLLRAGAEFESIVFKILNQSLNRIIVKDVLSLSPGILCAIFDIKLIPPIPKKSSQLIPTSKLTSTGSPSSLFIPSEDPKELVSNESFSKPMEIEELTRFQVADFLENLYACFSPYVNIVINDTKISALIDSASEMNIMSKHCYELIQEEFAIDTNIYWKFGSANLSANSMFGVYHAVPLDIAGMKTSISVFILTNIPEYLILGWPWDRLMRAQTDNTDEGLCWITLTSPDNQIKSTFCASPSQNKQNKNHVFDDGEDANMFPEEFSIRLREELTSVDKTSPVLSSNARGNPDWLRKKLVEEDTFFRAHLPKGRFKWLIPKFSLITQGSQLIIERINSLKINAELWTTEREMLLEFLFNREAEIAFTSSEKGGLLMPSSPSYNKNCPTCPMAGREFSHPKDASGDRN